MSTVNKLVQGIRENLTQAGASQKDEIEVMRAMLNDKEYQVGVYGKEGLVDTFCPSDNAREVISSAMIGAAKMNSNEAKQLADEYEFTKKDASNMVSISKEFVNTYMNTGRKLPLGGRENSDVSLVLKEVPEGTRSYPKKVGEDAAGKPIFEKAEAKVPAHNTLKVQGTCPEWLK